MIDEDAKHIVFIDEGYRRSSRAIVKASKLGYRVSLINRELPRFTAAYTTCCKQANPHDISDCIKAAREIHEILPIDGVVTLMERLPSVAGITSSLGLRGLSEKTARISQHKAWCRSLLENAGIKQPKFFSINLISQNESVADRADEVGYPCVLKPVGGAGGGAVFILHSRNDAVNAEARIRRLITDYPKAFGFFPLEIIIEKFISGKQYSIEGYITDGKIEVVTVTEKFLTLQKIEVMHITPARLSPSKEAAATHFGVRVAETLGLDDCLFHIEVVLSPRGWQLIEVNARMGGGCICTDLVPMAYNFCMVDTMCRVATGQKVAAKPKRTGIFAGVTLFRGCFPGQILSTRGEREAREVPGVVDVVMESAIEDVSDPAFLAADDRLGAIIVRGESATECIEQGDIASNVIAIAMKSQ